MKESNLKRDMLLESVHLVKDESNIMIFNNNNENNLTLERDKDNRHLNIFSIGNNHKLLNENEHLKSDL